jgi:glutaconate CoA-transferase, subunit B
MPVEASHAEIMVAVLARNMRDGEWGACGAYSEIPMAAFMLARAQHAPNLWWMSGGGGGLNPRTTLVPSSSSFDALHGTEGVFTIEDIVDYEFGGWRRTPNVGLFGGIQVDRRGSVNMVGVGEYPRLKLRGPGTVGLAFAAHFNRTMIYLHSHDPRLLCEEVDYVSAPGHTESRAAHVRSFSKGPELVVTPQAVIGFDSNGLAELRSITPGHQVAEVQDHTGYELSEAPGLRETELPTEEQLRIIREQIDPHGLLGRVSLGQWT